MVKLNQLKKIAITLFVVTISTVAVSQKAKALAPSPPSFVEISHICVNLADYSCNLTSIDIWCWYNGGWNCTHIYFGTVNGLPYIGLGFKITTSADIANNPNFFVALRNNELTINSSVEASAFLYELINGKLLHGNIPIVKNSNHIQLDEHLAFYFLQIVSEGQIVHQQSLINTNNSQQLISGGK